LSLSTSLARRLALKLTLAFVAVAAGLLAASIWTGRLALQREHEAASLRMAALFEASLHNAMLKRDLPGLESLLERTGSLPGLQAAALLEPGGEVRFASARARLHAREADALAGLCIHAACGALSAPRLAWREQDGTQALRVTYPVRNQPRCGGCHGPVAAKPVNGVLLLDFLPMAAEQTARQRAGTWLLPVSLAALALLGLATAWVLRREVLQPVSALATLAGRYAQGDLSARSAVAGQDELAWLARGFDHMAAQLQAQMAEVSAQGDFLQALVDASPDPMVVLADDHRIVLANVAYALLLGRRAEEVIGQPCHRISRSQADPCPATLLQCPLAQCRSHRAAGEAPPPLRTVMSFRHADGRPIDVEVHAAALTGRHGEPLVVELIRPLEDQVRASQEQRLSAIGLLANGVAHEIHNPLASIRLALQSSLRGLADESIEREELIEYLRLVDDQIDRCVSITQRLLRLSEPSAELAQPVAVRAAVDDVLALLAEEMHRASVRCELRIAPPAARVLMDEGELRQVVVNLVQNAVRAMPGGGLLRIEGERMDGERVEGAMLRLAVTDTGVGIPPEQLPLIFLPFYSRRADGRRGTGLGLAICKGLVEQRGGAIRASSRPGEGSRFEVDLPDADAGGSPPGERSESGEPGGTGFTEGAS
jgi:PAS domain S-box-containing protein